MEKKRASKSRYRQANRAKLKVKSDKYRFIHREEINQKELEKRHREKLTILTYYGDGRVACVLCGEADPRCLSIDHINGGGTKHRKTIRCNTHGWLIRQKFPEGFRTLCMNCQWKTRWP